MAMGNGFFYTVAGDRMGGDGTISIHRMEANGRLTRVNDMAVSGLPTYVTGLAAR